MPITRCVSHLETTQKQELEMGRWNTIRDKAFSYFKERQTLMKKFTQIHVRGKIETNAYSRENTDFENIPVVTLSLAEVKEIYATSIPKLGRHTLRTPTYRGGIYFPLTDGKSWVACTFKIIEFLQFCRIFSTEFPTPFLLKSSFSLKLVVL